MRVILTAFMILALASAAQAALSFEVVEVAISAAAMDPNGIPFPGDAALQPNTKCWDVQVTSTDDLIGFTITGLVPDPNCGGVYQNAAGTDGPPSPAVLPYVPALEFDTYVNMPGNLLLLSGSFAALPLEYGDLTSDPPDPPSVHGPQTDFAIARITLLDPDPEGWLYLTAKENSAGGPVTTTHNIRIPEPATMSLLALGGLAALRRRR